MELLVIFVTSLLCVQAYVLPYIDSVSSASSEEIQYSPSARKPLPPLALPLIDSVSSASSEEILNNPSVGKPPPSLLLPQIGSISSASSEEILNNPSLGKPPPSLPLLQIDSVSSASSEEILYIPTGGKQQPTLTGVGVVTLPILQAVKATEPPNSNGIDKNILLAQVLAAQDVKEHNFGDPDGKADDKNIQETNAGESLPILKLYGESSNNIDENEI